MVDNVIILIGQIVVFLGTIFTMFKGAYWFMKRIDERIDEKIKANPVIQEYVLTNYKLEELLKESTATKHAIQRIELKLERLSSPLERAGDG